MAEGTSRYVKEWLSGDRILVYRFSDLSPNTIDEWVVDITHELTGWSSEKTWRLMLDIRLHGNVVNTYALRRARDIASLRPDVPGRLAIMVASKLASDIISMALRAANNTYRKRLVFVNEALAIHWLLDEKLR
ncbi:MAG: hypothetical protein K8L97_04940 [Anaerolineae bacterium]|nr:hypothetical protein [Anaerolineae bacterium]